MYSANGIYTTNNNKTFKDTKLYGVGNIPNSDSINIENAKTCINDKIKSLEIGASIHKEIRKHIRPHLKPGLKLSELANLIENKCKELTENQGVNEGIGFPQFVS